MVKKQFLTITIVFRCLKCKDNANRGENKMNYFIFYLALRIRGVIELLQGKATF